MRKRIGMCLVLAFILLGFRPADSYQGEVTIALTNEPNTMDPHVATDTTGAIVWRWTFDTLASLEPGTGKVVPWLAERWEKLGPKRVKFWLRKGIKFTDGTPLTAEAVAYAMSRIFDPKNKSTHRAFFKTFDRIEILDPHTFIWHSKTPDNGLFNRLTIRPGIMSPKTKDWDKAKISLTPVGSGPYVLKSWTKGQKMVFDANPDWWGNARYPNRPKVVTLRRIREASTRANALLTGEVDVIAGVAPQFIERLQKAPATKVASVPSVRIMYVSFVTRHGGPFANPKVRLAVNYAIDADKIRATILGGRADDYGQLFHPWNFSGYNPDKKWHGYDLAKAKALMKEAGYPNGFKGEILSPSGRYTGDKQICEAVSGMLKEIKIDLKCNAAQFPLYVKNFGAYKQGKKKGAVMHYMGFANNHGDSSLILKAILSCTGFWSGHCFKDLDADIDKAASIADPAAQQAAFERISDVVKERATHKILFKNQDVYGLRKTLDYMPRHDEVVYPWEIRMK